MTYEDRASEMVTISASTSGATSGTFTLTGDVMGGASGALGTATKIVIPKGMSLKVWTRELSGPGLTVNFQYAQDGSTFSTIVSDVLAATGEIDNEKRRPHLFRGSAGTETVKITFSGANASTSSTVTFDLEFTQDN